MKPEINLNYSCNMGNLVVFNLIFMAQVMQSMKPTIFCTHLPCTRISSLHTNWTDRIQNQLNNLQNSSVQEW